MTLKPRAIAVLCALRTGPRSRVSLRDAIGDISTTATLDLLGDMRRDGLIGQVKYSVQWYLDNDGYGWLQSNGLDALPESRMVHP